MPRHKVKHYVGYAHYSTRVRFEFDATQDEARDKANDIATHGGMCEATKNIELDLVDYTPDWGEEMDEE